MAENDTKRTVMNVSWGDHLEAWDGDDAMDRPGRILRCAERWRREFGAGAIYWREMKTWSKFRICFSAPGAPPRRVFEDYERQGFGEHERRYGPHCTRHGCRLHVARMWSAHDPEENASLLDTEGVSGLVIGPFGAAVDRRCGGVRPDVSPSA